MSGTAKMQDKISAGCRKNRLFKRDTSWSHQTSTIWNYFSIVVAKQQEILQIEIRKVPAYSS
jgi:hypothetical protein